MNFRFKLYRILNAINLFFSGLFLMGCLYSLLMGGMLEGIMGMVLLGAVFIHGILSLSLQKSLMDSQYGLKENTHGGIRAMGLVSQIYGGLLFLVMVFALQVDKNEMMTEMMKNVPAAQQQESMALLKMMFPGVFIFGALYGASIFINVLLSYEFLRAWKVREEKDQEF